MAMGLDFVESVVPGYSIVIIMIASLFIIIFKEVANF